MFQDKSGNLDESLSSYVSISSSPSFTEATIGFLDY